MTSILARKDITGAAYRHTRKKMKGMRARAAVEDITMKKTGSPQQMWRKK